MRILHVCHQYFPAIGGAENYIVDLSEELAKRGHQIDVYTTQSTDYHTWRNLLPARERINQVEVHRFPSLQRRAYIWRMLRFALSNYNFAKQRPRWLEPLVYFGNGPVSPALFAAIWKNARGYDLIHISQLHYAHAYTAFRAAHLRKAPIVVTPLIHAEQPVTFSLGYLTTVLKQSDALLALTQAEQRFLLDRNLNDVVVWAGSGLQLKRFPSISQQEARQRLGIAQDKFVILFLGRKIEYKGLDITLQAFAILQQEYTNIQLLAFGPETDYSTELWKNYANTPNIDRRGAVSEEERLDALAACDVLVLPSTGESFGIVYLEAWAYQKAVIGARINAVASLIDEGSNGMLVGGGQTHELKRKLAMLIENPDLKNTLGKNGHKKLLARYTTEKIGDIIEATYARVLRHRALKTES